MDHDIRHEQIAYYRARAQEYDESTGESKELKGAFALVRDLLLQLGSFEQILELACGTGTWTRVLLQIGRQITALDAAPEMLALAQQKLGNTPSLTRRQISFSGSQDTHTIWSFSPIGSPMFHLKTSMLF